ncbi:MAG: DUF167 domain-containing protein [Phycisphaerales bacterium]
MTATLRVKVVPGAKRDEVIGPLGDRLKIRLSAPPEGGKANQAVCELVAATLGVDPRSVRVAHGTTSPLKTLAIEGCAQERADVLLEPL